MRPKMLKYLFKFKQYSEIGTFLLKETEYTVLTSVNCYIINLRKHSEMPVICPLLCSVKLSH